MNNKGFTLVELLGSMVILGLLMLMVVPNIVGLLNSNRNSVYVDDAKKMIIIAKSKATAKKFKLPTNNGECTFLGLAYLDNAEFDNPPFGGCYDVNRSYVVIKRVGDEYQYFVELIEYHDGKNTGFVTTTSESNLKKTSVSEGDGDMYYDYTLEESAGVVDTCSGYADVKIKNGTKTYSSNVGICAR